MRSLKQAELLVYEMFIGSWCAVSVLAAWRFPLHSRLFVLAEAGGFALAWLAAAICYLSRNHVIKTKAIRDLQVENEDLQKALTSSQVQALRMKLHPHFLFNALQGIATLMDTDRTVAKVMLVKLASFLRRTLEHSDSDLISFEEELKFIREYLDLEQLRLGERLQVDWSIDAGSEQTLVPQLILQPLVENAIQHGIARSRDGGWIQIASRMRQGLLEIQIRNSMSGSRTSGLGIGLRTTEARLRCLYLDDASLSFKEAGDQTATATIRLPALTFGEGRSIAA
jgi:LytS/YehU family sensor histidine kinase